MDDPIKNVSLAGIEQSMTAAIAAAQDGKANDMITPDQLDNLRQAGYVIPSDRINYEQQPTDPSLAAILADSKQSSRLTALAKEAGVSVGDVFAASLDKRALVLKRGGKRIQL